VAKIVVSGDAATFSNTGDRILGTRREGTVIFNCETSQEVGLLPHSSGNIPVKSSWSPDDDLVLCGSSLWDPRRSRQVHQFEILGDYEGSNVFHPSGLEVIVSSEVWDLRTFRLLRSVPALDGADAKFSRSGDVIFAVPSPHRDEESLSGGRGFRDPLRKSCFRTIDASTYRELTTYDVEKPIMNLITDPMGWFVAVGEDSDPSSVVRLYEAGRNRRRADDYLNGDDDSDDSEEEDEDESDFDGFDGDEALLDGLLGPDAMDAGFGDDEEFDELDDEDDVMDAEDE